MGIPMNSSVSSNIQLFCGSCYYIHQNYFYWHVIGYLILKRSDMNNLFRGLIAGYGAKKLGGGCLGTVLVFVLIWVLLGQC